MEGSFRITFRVTKTHHPKLLADFLSSKTRWAHCEILVISAPARTQLKNASIRYRGHLPSLAPYFVFSTNVKWLTSMRTSSVAPVDPDRIDFEYASPKLTLKYRTFLCDEVRARTGHDVKGAERMEFDARYFTFNDLRAHDLFFNNCDYFRLGREQLIRKFCPGTPPKNVWGMSIEEMVKLIDNFLSVKPWLLMFPQWQEKFGLKGVRYGKMVAARNFWKVKPERHERLGMEFFNFVLTTRKKGGDTYFDTHEMVTRFAERKPEFRNEQQRNLALGFLAYKGLWFFEPDRHAFVLRADKDRIEQVWEILRDMRAREAETEIKHTPKLDFNDPDGLTDEQHQAVRHVRDNWLTMILGSPGHGKSQAIVDIVKRYPRVLVCTYVGMAVDMLKKRLKPHNFEDVYTIHYLYYRCMYDEAAETWLEEFDILVVDEFSNVDIKLCWHLLRCIKDFKRLVLVGDLDQINPIDPGIPFRDLVEAFPEKVFYFTRNMRADKDAHALVDAAVHVKNNELDALDFNTRCLSLVPRPAQNAVATVLNRELRAHANEMMDFQIICLKHTYKNEINLYVEGWLIEMGIVSLPAKETLLRKGFPLFEGQKITFTKNIKKSTPDSKYDGVRNGELGCIQRISRDTRRGATVLHLDTKKKICIGDGENQIPALTIDRGYAITCNKSQGSEWRHVLFWVHDKLEDFWTREYLYVAVSRAKSSVRIVGSMEDLKQMCRHKTPHRETYLSRLIETTREERDTGTDTDDTTEESE